MALRVAKWTELQKLTINAEKTISIYFREMWKMWRKGNPKTNPGMTYLGKSFKMASPVKYLGVMIDRKLNVMAHCANLKESLTDYVKATNLISRRNWVLSGDFPKRVYKKGIERLDTYVCRY